ncbi:MAG: energy transducer TonB [Porphyromonadaceae bacterium]|nr:energy transducer TonB [Porphyromonadaceae bacterium]
MEIKKSPQADLEKSKSLSLLLGLVVALSLLFVTLEWRSTIAKAIDTAVLSLADLDDALIVQDEQQEEEPEPEPEPEQQIEAQLPEEFTTVDNEKEVAKVAFVSADEAKPTPPPVVVAAPVEEEDANQIFEIVEESTEFPGGQAALMKYLSNNVRYPEIAQENGIQGRVIVGFVIERDGKPSQVEVLRGVDPALDKEAVRVVSGMPAWKPGKQRGKPVRQRFRLPVVFRLQ